MRDRVAVILTTAVVAFHAAFANRYDLFRDELYFIVCGRHPAFGYADQPPLVPLLAAGAYAIGAQTWLVRVPAILAAGALVWVVVAFARLLGARDVAAWIAGLAAGTAPVLIGLTATLNTTTFEPLAWTVVAYALARVALLDDRRALLWAGVVAGLALEAKYALPVWLLALTLAVSAFPERRLFRYRELWLGVAIASVIAAPSVMWQLAHGLPFVELVRNAGEKDVATAPLAFELNQVFLLGPLFAPIWLAGLIGPFAIADLRAVRFLSLAFLFAALAIVAGHGKDYYLAPAYPPLFAIGGIVIERLVALSFLRVAYTIVAVALALIIAPLALPVLAPSALLSYELRLHLKVAAQEQGDAGDALPSTFADMLGWHDFVAEVGRAYEALSMHDRARTSILVDNYGEAAAIDLYGAAYNLPPALSGHNQYFFWGLRDQQPAHILRVGRHADRLKPYCAQMQVLGTTHSRYARSFENGKAIAFCRDVHPSLSTLWSSFRLFV